MKTRLKRWLAGIIAMLMIVATVFGEGQAEVSQAAGTPIVEYQVHVQKKGWTNYVSQGIAGTTGQGLRLEAMRIKVSGIEGLGIRYRAHVQSYGWLDYVENGSLAGTTGKSKRMEAIQIELTGEQAANYDVYYRVHAQTYGWMNWAKNGEVAGTKGFGKRMEALQICILPKGSTRPAGTGVAYTERKAIAMTAHVQTYGWMAEVEAGKDILGTTGSGKRMEAITLNPVGYDMNVEYSVHVQSIGWTDYKKNGEVAGTVGQGKRLEAVKIRLTGADADKYDIYYRAHVQKFGWLDWAKNDETAGSIGHSYRMEALEVRLVAKGSAAPGNETRATVTMPGITYCAYVQNRGWQNSVSNQQTAGTVGKGLGMQSIRIQTTGDDKLGVEYSVYENGAWSPFVKGDTVAGVTNYPIEGIKIRLTGEDAKAYDVYYRVHSQTYGWFGWACNGAPAGTSMIKKSGQAIEIAIRSKAQAAPGSTREPYRDHVDTEAEALAKQKLNQIGWSLEAAFNWSSHIPYYTNSTAVPAGYTNADWYAIYGFRNGRGNCYNMAATFYQMAKVLGYDVHYVQGYLPQANGRRVTHGWCEIVQDGQIRVYDPNFTYNRGTWAFGITYGTPGTWRYIDYQRLN